ncbi:MAG TPA: hypothetical protein VKN99_23185 [Polyangia bacterium]|nr:hypothetical protein [Polyangia bacterium]
MSAMGERARRAQRQLMAALGTLRPQDECDQAPDCDDGGLQDPDGPGGGGQAETTIAVDDTGQHIVIGFNDTRGFSSNPISVSGFMFSDDGGRNFVDGGQLPSPGTDLIGTTKFPQVFGDPDVKYLGDCNFIYSSIVLAQFAPDSTATVQTMGFHRSTDCGHTWEGPFVIPPASNPNGLVNASGAPRDAADKEYIDADRSTGRVLLSWSNFSPVAVGGVEISTTFSDNVLEGEPTWSDRAVVAATAQDGQASNPQFGLADSGTVYLAWSRFPPGLNNIGFARSTDGGATWSEPVSLTDNFTRPDQVLGNDRIHAFPALAVDRSRGRHRGNVYVAYINNDNLDGSDVMFQSSNDDGLTFSAPIALNSRPGNDRSQWFPWLAVDDLTGRVFLFYYDQAIAESGDLTEVTFTFSDDAGGHWAQPRPLSKRPFRGGFGNDTGQPNLGDYNMSVVHAGALLASFAATHPVGFTDGEPESISFTVPEVNFRSVGRGQQVAVTTVAPGEVSFTESGGDGFLDPGDTANLAIPLTNYVENPLNARRIPFVVGLVSTTTPGVRVLTPATLYGSLEPGETQENLVPIRLRLDAGFAAGTDIELRMRAISPTGVPATLFFTLHTGTPVETVLLSEDFDGVEPGTLPEGWNPVHGAGGNTVRWTTSDTFCGSTSNAAFHINANDGVMPTGSQSRWERLLSPAFAVPADAEYVVIEFDVCYDTEDAPPFHVLAFDGLFLRITDLTTGHILRSVLAEAFATDFTTDGFFHYPKHFPRSNDPGYFPLGDMSAWAGDSGGIQHVRLRLPGMAGTTAQLRFEYTQDANGICSDLRPEHSCGVMVDNIVVKSVVSRQP